MIPTFDEQGNLPSGIYVATWQEVKESLSFSERRVLLLERLYEALTNLKNAACQTAYLDGSFASRKENPGDIDVCYDPRGVVGVKLDPVFLDFSNLRAAQKARYGCERSP